MERFTVRLYKSGYASSSVALPRDLRLLPRRWSASDRGGMKTATVDAAGTKEELASLASWLGDHIEIMNGVGDCVWWGIVWDIEISLGSMQLSLTMDNVYNRIRVIYPHVLGDGSLESATTDWVEDADSVRRYGTRELVYGLPEAFTGSADIVRDRLLDQYKTPAPIISAGAKSDLGATLTGVGMWQRAATVYYNNPAGLIEYTDQSGTSVIGMFIQSNTISFGADTPGGEEDEMYIASGNFDPLAVDDTITVSGADAPPSGEHDNNDTYTVTSRDASNQLGVSSTLTPDTAGPTVKISYGDNISYDNIAVSFIPTVSFTCTHLSVCVRRVGTPSDSFRIGLYPDSAGVPGAFLNYNETLGSALFSELTWTEFAFSTPVSLVAGTKYWIGMRRTGIENLGNGYEVAIDEGLGYSGGTAIFYNGSAWVTRSPDADVPFRVIGEIDSSEQISKAITAAPDFGDAVVQVASDIPIRQYIAEEEQRTLMDEVTEMLDAGMADGSRLVLTVSREGSVIVDVPPTLVEGRATAVLGADGKLHYGNGALQPPGNLIYGQYIEIEDLFLLQGMGALAARGSTVYIQESEYDATNDVLSVQAGGALDPWQALTIRKG